MYQQVKKGDKGLQNIAQIQWNQGKVPDGQFPHVTFPWPNIMLVFILKIELDHQTTEMRPINLYKIQYEDKSHNLVDYIC